MALLLECMQKCCRKLLDTADIVRDGDFSPFTTAPTAVCARRVRPHSKRPICHQSRQQVRFARRTLSLSLLLLTYACRGSTLGASQRDVAPSQWFPCRENNPH